MMLSGKVLEIWEGGAQLEEVSHQGCILGAIPYPGLSCLPVCFLSDCDMNFSVTPFTVQTETVSEIDSLGSISHPSLQWEKRKCYTVYGCSCRVFAYAQGPRFNPQDCWKKLGEWNIWILTSIINIASVVAWERPVHAALFEAVARRDFLTLRGSHSKGERRGRIPPLQAVLLQPQLPCSRAPGPFPFLCHY